MSYPKLRRLAIGLLVFCLAQVATAQVQSPYHLSVKRELIWTGGSLVGIGGSYLIDARVKTFTPAQVANLHLTDVPSFDRFVTKQYSGTARSISDWMLYVSPVIPLLLMADPAIRPHARQSLFLVGEALLVNTALNRLVKEIVLRPRPFTYNATVPIDPKLTKDARFSFYSGHTSAAASLAFSTATIWSDYHPGSKWKPLVWTGAAAFPAVVGWMRVKGGKHFLSDVVVGYGVGAVVGWLVPHLHKNLTR